MRPNIPSCVLVTGLENTSSVWTQGLGEGSKSKSKRKKKEKRKRADPIDWPLLYPPTYLPTESALKIYIYVYIYREQREREKESEGKIIIKKKKGTMTPPPQWFPTFPNT